MTLWDCRCLEFQNPRVSHPSLVLEQRNQMMLMKGKRIIVLAFLHIFLRLGFISKLYIGTICLLEYVYLLILKLLRFFLET